MGADSDPLRDRHIADGLDVQPVLARCLAAARGHVLAVDRDLGVADAQLHGHCVTRQRLVLCAGLAVGVTDNAMDNTAQYGYTSFHSLDGRQSTDQCKWEGREGGRGRLGVADEIQWNAHKWQTLRRQRDHHINTEFE